MRRVVITGMGAVTPVGNSVPEMWDAVKNGVCGIGPITRFDTEKFPVKLAAEVKDFDAREYMPKAEMLKTDRYAQFGFAAACQAMEESQIEGKVDPEKMGVYMGTGIGGITTFVQETTKLIEKGPRRVSPFFIPMLISNMSSGMIAIRFDCRGAAMPSVIFWSAVSRQRNERSELCAPSEFST